MLNQTNTVKFVTFMTRSVTFSLFVFESLFSTMFSPSLTRFKKSKKVYKVHLLNNINAGVTLVLTQVDFMNSRKDFHKTLSNFILLRLTKDYSQVISHTLWSYI
uniref:Uncharacterized protein n=1 Tax=Glossina brevipalpis TaxID=37001 RepID=A0A1A9WZT6_9MUSC